MAEKFCYDKKKLMIFLSDVKRSENKRRQENSQTKKNITKVPFLEIY